MKIFRKMQQKVELKIKHAISTGKLHHLERGPASGDSSRPAFEKADGSDLTQSK